MQIAISDTYTIAITDVVSKSGVQEEVVTFGQRDAAVFESFDADLGALQIADYADEPATIGSDFPKQFKALSLRVVITVRKVEPGHIQTGTDHFTERFRIVGSRTERRNYLCSAQHGRDYCTGG